MDAGFLRVAHSCRDDDQTGPSNVPFTRHRVGAMKTSLFSRRRFLLTSAIPIVGAILPTKVRAQAAPKAKVLDTKVISLDAQFYHGWPTLARRRNGQLLVVYSGGREAHVCPFGRVDLIVSNDHGQSWSWPRTVLDSDLDDRDAGVLETSNGTLLVTTFTSLAYEPILQAAQKIGSGSPGAWPAERLARWQAAYRRLDAAQRQSELGQWMMRSRDGGMTWSPRYASIVNSPHGPIELSDGRLLHAGKELWTIERRVGVCESLDDGATWRWLAQIPTRPGDAAPKYHELHAVESSPGRLLAQIRNHNEANDSETLQTESTDGGKTWSVPHPIGVWGLPSHLLKLRDNCLLMTYGYRRAPLGNHARISADEGRTWSEPLVISSDGGSSDLGYPSTAQLEDGTLLTVWYEGMKGSPCAVLRQAKWRWEE